MAKRGGLTAMAALACAILAMGAVAVEPEWVVVGDPGNAHDTHVGHNGSVDHIFRISKFEVTAGAYTELLNAVAADDPYGLYDTEMVTSTYGCRIQRSGTAGAYTYSVSITWADRPVNFVDWGDAARYANWLHNGQPIGYQDASTTEDGAYDLTASHPCYESGVTRAHGSDAWEQVVIALCSVERRPDARVFIPTLDEWYKAAFFDAAEGVYYDYATRSDNVPGNMRPGTGNSACFYVPYANPDYTVGSPYYRTPVGLFADSPSPYGTFDQSGNVREWTETSLGGLFRASAGGSALRSEQAMRAPYQVYAYPDESFEYHGFRVAAAYEPECGDGFVDREAGERCDDGNVLDEDGCSASCVPEYCGDGIQQAGLGEQCDDGNSVAEDGCDECTRLVGSYCETGLDCVLINSIEGGGPCEWDNCGGYWPNECDPPVPTVFGDVTGASPGTRPNGSVNLGDLMCALDAYGVEGIHACPNADVVSGLADPCQGGDGVVELADILAILDAFQAPEFPGARYMCDCPDNH